MKRAPRISLLAIASGFLIAIGCNRHEPPAQTQPQAGARPAPPRLAAPPAAQQRSDATPREAPFAELQLTQSPVESEKGAPQLAKPEEPNRYPAADVVEGMPVERMQGSKEVAALTKKADVETSKKGAKKREADALFDEPSLVRIRIEIPPAGLNALRRTHWEGGGARPIAKVTVREGDRVYTNVAVHLKGAAGSFRPVESKPALTLNFDKFVPGQSFHGLHKISLNNSVQDSTYLCEKISRELFIAAGVPVPRAAHALVEINGKEQGLYVLLEGANRQFLKRYFDNADGNMYDGGFCREISTRLPVNCGENPGNHTGLRSLSAVVNAGQPNFARLEKVLDVDRFMAMMALEMILCHWDGYTLNKNNWRVFHDLTSNRMVFIPHGLDQLFGAGRQFEGGNVISPQHVSGRVSSALLSTPEGQRRYRETALRVYTNVFKVDEISRRIDQVASGVGASLAETHPQMARSFQQRANALKQRIIRRAEGLRRQLGGAPIRTMEFGSEGIIPLTGWKPSLVQSGDPILSQAKDPTGRNVLAIAAGESPSSSSWRTRAVLAPGRYQLEGRLRVKGVVAEEGDQRAGAGLRISKGTMPRKLLGTSDWKESRYTFDIEEQATDVEFICELKANAGEAWFDLSSLRLVRVQ